MGTFGFAQVRGISFFQEADPTSALIAVGVFIVFIFLLILAGRAGGGKKKEGEHRRFSKWAFRSLGKKKGLAKGQIYYLEGLIEKYNVSLPFKLLENSNSLNKVLAYELREIDESAFKEDEKDVKKHEVYKIKQQIEKMAAVKYQIKTTRHIKLGHQLIIVSPKGHRYPSQVTGNLPEVLAAEVPKNSKFQYIKWQNGDRVRIYFWVTHEDGFYFNSKVTGYSNVHDVTSVLFQHSKKLVPVKQRKLRRKEFSKSAYITPVIIATLGVGRDAKKQAIVQHNRKFLGAMQDLSGGGCRVRSRSPLPEGSLVKIDFEIERQDKITVYGKVVRRSDDGKPGGVMHVKFTRVSKKHMNQINSFVYNMEHAY